MRFEWWRAIVVLAVVLSSGVGIYELLAPRIDLADGVVAPVGPWFTLPGRTTATYRVLSERPGSNLAAAGVAVGDLYVPHDSFAARWLWNPGQRVPVTAFHNGAARETAIVASGRPLPEDLLSWVARTGRVILRVAMLLLAIVVVWHIADAPWTRWLAAFLIFLGFAPWQVDPLEYVGWWRVAAFELEGMTTQAAICTAMLFAVTIRGQPPSGFRTWMVRLAPLVFVILSLFIVANLFDARSAYITAPQRLLELLCIVASVAALSVAASDATGQQRLRLRYMAWTFALGFSGFFFSFAALWAIGGSWGNGFQQWALPRLTLILIPIGLGYGLLSHRVVSSHYIASRALVYGAITSAFVPLFAATEWAARSLFGTQKNVFIVAIAVIITASFRKIQKGLESFFNSVIFRKEHAIERKLDGFAKEVTYIDDRSVLIERFVTTLDAGVGPISTALYECSQDEVLDAGSGGYVRIASAGAPPPERVERLDPIVVSLHADGTAEWNGLGEGGHAFAMVARGRLVGLCGIGPQRDGEILAPDEIARLAKLTQQIAVALEGMRLDDLRKRLAEAQTQRDELQRVLTEAARSRA